MYSIKKAPYRITTDDRKALNARGYSNEDIREWLNDESRPLTAKEVKELLKMPIIKNVGLISETSSSGHRSTVKFVDAKIVDDENQDDPLDDYQDEEREVHTEKMSALISRYTPIADLSERVKHVFSQPLILIGFSLVLMVLGWIALSAVASWWQDTSDTLHYGQVRTYQTDIVGLHDSSASPTHITVTNFHGKILVTLLPGGDVKEAKLFVGVVLQGDTAGKIPVEAHFSIDKAGSQHLILTSRIGNYDLIEDGKGGYKPNPSS